MFFYHTVVVQHIVLLRKKYTIFSGQAKKSML